jgi:hypothetical protein
LTRRLKRTAACAAVLLSFFVCDVGAQAPAASLRNHTDTVLFNRDTVLLHGTADVAKVSAEFARYIAAMRPMPGLPQAPSSSTINIYLAENERAFRVLTGGAAPHWGAGIALPDSGIIVLPAYTSKRAGVQDMGPVIRHEIAHVALQRALPGLQIPRWFTEGYAGWTAGELDPDGDWYLRMAFLTHRAPSLDSLELDWPAYEADARAAYLLSASAVAYLHSLGTPAQFDTLILRWQRTRSLEQAMRTTYLISSAQFERIWAKHVRRHYGWLLFAAQGAVVWGFITVLAVILIILRRRRDAYRLEAMRRNEIPDAPAYWVDPPVPDETEDPPSGLTGEPDSDKLAP